MREIKIDVKNVTKQGEIYIVDAIMYSEGEVTILKLMRTKNEINDAYYKLSVDYGTLFPTKSVLVEVDFVDEEEFDLINEVFYNTVAYYELEQSRKQEKKNPLKDLEEKLSNCSGVIIIN